MNKRAELLKIIIDTRFGGVQSDFARAIGKSPSQVNQWITGYRALGNGAASQIEKKLHLGQGFFDAIDRPSIPTIAPPALPPSVEELLAQLKVSTDGLPPAVKKAAADMIAGYITSSPEDEAATRSAIGSVIKTTTGSK